MVFLRGHYTIDLITGIVLGHYFWIIGRRLGKFCKRVVVKQMKEKYEQNVQSSN
jgi:hypothetical protein